MSIIKWSPMLPWHEFDKMFEELMPSKNMMKTSGFMPAVDVYETKKEVMVELSIPHIDADKIDISIDDNVLHVKGSTEKKSEVEDKNYYRKEIRSGGFYRAIPLPANVIADKTSAVHEEGVLKIALPKAPEKKTKKIQVKVNKKKPAKK